VTVTARTGRAHGGRQRRGHWRLDPTGRHARGHRPAAGRRTEPEDYELCLALLEEAIARAERWLARRERALADFDLRAAQMVNRLRSAGVLGSSTRWDRREGDVARLTPLTDLLPRHGPQHAAERERAGYVSAMRVAHSSPYGSWS
jgi:hypothetical protein